MIGVVYLILAIVLGSALAIAGVYEMAKAIRESQRMNLVTGRIER